MKRLDLEALIADREAVRTMLARISDEDPIGRLSFSARLASLEEKIQKLADVREHTGSIALLFAGAPVHGSRSISADFVMTVLKPFQDLVTKRIAGEEFGRLGSRGRIPERTPSALAIRELVRGSVGFVLEESSVNAELTDTPVKKAIGDVTLLIRQAAAESDVDFEVSVETLDPRMLISLRDFFRALDDHDASVRIVEDERDASLDGNAVRRARLRVDATDVEDTESDEIVGELLGLLPDSRKFEMQLAGTGEIIRGSVGAPLATRWLALIEQTDERLVGQVWRAKMRIREIRERSRPPRSLYTLLDLIERR
ncbi:MAG: hypothetical protein UZ18_ATM001000098 [Armatimonadetes bacterium OLB18]|nr:MAG: hypothetical protein UZ18_ATM001000098 [Armatimonadetes bacterium OLB18]MCZ2099651.1 hypothetical protein [Anaerolineae bacterium]